MCVLIGIAANKLAVRSLPAVLAAGEIREAQRTTAEELHPRVCKQFCLVPHMAEPRGDLRTVGHQHIRDAASVW